MPMHSTSERTQWANTYGPQHPLSSLAHKNQRVAQAAGPLLSSPPIHLLSPAPFRFERDSSMIVKNIPTPFADRSMGSMENSLTILEAQSHAVRRKYMEKEQDDKETKNTYRRHVKNYVDWWTTSQAQLASEDITHFQIPAFPITVAKVMMFLQHEETRPKRKRGSDDIQGSSLGVSHFKQTISALEHQRFNDQHQFQKVPEAQVSLRRDPRIRTFESAVAHNEPQRVARSQALKAAGTNADTYTTEELQRCAWWFLDDSHGPRQIFTQFRDMAQFLASTVLALRGDSSRSLLWSDMYPAEIPMNDIALGAKVKALAILSDNAKHNQTGRTDEYAAFRHRHVELCAIGAIARVFFANFHILNIAMPSFVPDFSAPGFGEYGRRDWYALYTFSTRTPQEMMTYENHRERVNIMHAKNDISITKVTHAGRGYTVKTARENGSSANGAKALGGWSESGSFRPCYDRAHPIDAMLGAAMFNGNKPESYFLPRGVLVPPLELMNAIFPWVEGELTALNIRQHQNRFAKDIALQQFLRLLKWFRLVLLQDAAVLYQTSPQCPLFAYAPFNSQQFRLFSAQSTSHITKAEEEARLAFNHLPEHLVLSLRGAVSSMSLEQQQEREMNEAHRTRVEEQLTSFGQFLQQLTTSKRSRRGVLPPFLPSASTLPPSLPTSPLSSTLCPSHTPAIASLTLSSATVNVDAHTTSNPRTSVVAAPATPLVSAAPTAGSCDPRNTPALRPRPIDALPMFSLPPQPTPAIAIPESGAQHAAWGKLVTHFGDDKLQRHQWDWDPKDQVWLPHYIFQPVMKISDIWHEYSEGLQGLLSVRDLNTTWGARWRRNHRGQKTEAGRRKSVIELIETLASKPQWNTALALRFLRDRYEKSMTPRGFIDYLKKDKSAGMVEVLRASQSYP